MASVFLVADSLLGGAKRKCVDDVSEDFSQFSLSSPARKMRRLDAFVPPIVIDNELENAMDSSLAQCEIQNSVDENKSYIPTNIERALVLYKPMNTPSECGDSSCVSFQVDNNVLAGLKEKKRATLSGMEEVTSGFNASQAVDNSLAVVPWVPPRFADDRSNAMAVQGQQSYPVEAESKSEDEPVSMEVEEENVDGGSSIMNPVASGTSIQQWQQHCMDMPPVVSASIPAMWSW